MHCARSKCCNAQIVLDGGYSCCVACGGISKRELSSEITPFESTATHALVSQPYTRTSRFTKKILGALLGSATSHHKCQEGLLAYLRERMRRGVECSTPESILMRIAEYKSKSRKPYIHARAYYEALWGVTPISPPENEIRFISLAFEEIYFAWTRLDLGTPRFPMTTVLRLIVDYFDLTNSKFLVRFGRVLRCPNRKQRYQENFKLCIQYLKQNGRSRLFYSTNDEKNGC